MCSKVHNRFSKRPLLMAVHKEDSEANPQASANLPAGSVMDTVATAMDDLCLSLNNEPKDKLKKLSEHMKVIKKGKKKKKKSGSRVS